MPERRGVGRDEAEGGRIGGRTGRRRRREVARRHEARGRHERGQRGRRRDGHRARPVRREPARARGQARDARGRRPRDGGGQRDRVRLDWEEGLDEEDVAPGRRRRPGDRAEIRGAPRVVEFGESKVAGRVPDLAGLVAQEEDEVEFLLGLALELEADLVFLERERPVVVDVIPDAQNRGGPVGRAYRRLVEEQFLDLGSRLGTERIERRRGRGAPLRRRERDRGRERARRRRRHRRRRRDRERRGRGRGRRRVESNPNVVLDPRLAVLDEPPVAPGPLDHHDVAARLERVEPQRGGRRVERRVRRDLNERVLLALVDAARRPVGAPIRVGVARLPVVGVARVGRDAVLVAEPIRHPLAPLAQRGAGRGRRDRLARLAVVAPHRGRDAGRVSPVEQREHCVARRRRRHGLDDDVEDAVAEAIAVDEEGPGVVARRPAEHVLVQFRRAALPVVADLQRRQALFAHRGRERLELHRPLALGRRRRRRRAGRRRVAHGRRRRRRRLGRRLAGVRPDVVERRRLGERSDGDEAERLTIVVAHLLDGARRDVRDERVAREDLARRHDDALDRVEIVPAVAAVRPEERAVRDATDDEVEVVDEERRTAPQGLRGIVVPAERHDERVPLGVEERVLFGGLVVRGDHERVRLGVAARGEERHVLRVAVDVERLPENLVGDDHAEALEHVRGRREVAVPQSERSRAGADLLGGGDEHGLERGPADAHGVIGVALAGRVESVLEVLLDQSGDARDDGRRH
mmetsp:Transcript_18237/g.57328  ORF Transcript_18237/g.57328 Transcript_18237/m.57328 type:complete len:750 (-) Transcript_18237:1659-3908(-)